MKGPRSNRKEFSLRARPGRGSSVRADSSIASLHASRPLRAGLGGGGRPLWRGSDFRRWGESPQSEKPSFPVDQAGILPPRRPGGWWVGRASRGEAQELHSTQSSVTSRAFQTCFSHTDVFLALLCSQESALSSPWPCTLPVYLSSPPGTLGRL